MQINTSDALLIAAYTIVVFVGLCGNSLVIHVVRTRRSMHSTMNFLLVNLAIADLLILVLCLPGKLLPNMAHSSSKVLEIFLCKFITTHHIAGIGMLVSGLTLTLISMERYKALVRAMNARSWRLSKGNVIYAIAAIWIFATVYVIPLFVLTSYDENKKTCTTYWPVHSANGNPYWILLSILVMFGFLIMFACYFSIIKGLYFTNTICNSNAQAGGQEDAVVKRRIVKTLLTVTVVFVACFLPYAIATATDISPNSVFYSVSYLLVYCSSSLNPFTYAIGSENYRIAFKEVLTTIKLCW